MSSDHETGVTTLPRSVAVLVMIAAAAAAATTAPTTTTTTTTTNPTPAAGRWGFSQGLRPLVVEAADGGSLSARGCAACHRQVYEDWQSTRHAVAFSNRVFLDGFAREPQARCVHCHAPLLEQRRELGPLRPPPSSSAAAASSSLGLLHEGVTCAACHVRGGKVLVTRAVRPDDGGPMHDVVVEPGLQDPAFCASCHQFGFSGDGVLMQGTYDEWRRFADGGGVGTCQSCHMPGGRHLFRGAWDTALLERSLHVDVERVEAGVERGGGSVVLALSSVDVGHAFPTGDLFRHLTVEARVDADNDDDWRSLLRIGRSFGVATGSHPARKVLTADTSLQPGVVTRVALPATSTAWRVRYHYAEARHEQDGVVDPVVIAGGDLQ